MLDLFKGARGYGDLLDRMRTGVEDGSLPAGTRLPSQRNLAYKLGVAVGTVTRAYQEAEQVGLIISYVGRGSFVTHPGVSIMGTKPSKGSGVAIDLTLDEPLEGFTPDLSAALQKLAADKNNVGLLDYNNASLAARHRAAGATWVSGFDLKVSPDNIVVCAGAQHAILCSLSTLCSPGDKIIAEEMCYPGLRGAAQMLSLRIEGAALDVNGIIPSSVESICKAGAPRALYLTPTLQNPTNGQLNKARRMQLAALAVKYDFAIIEDDLRPRSVLPSPAPIASLIPDRTFYIAGISKTLGGGLRIAYLVVPETRRAAVSNAVWESVYMASPLTAELVAQWVETGAAEATAQRKEQEAARRRELLERHLGHLDVRSRTGSTTAWIPLPKGWSNVAAVASLRDKGVAVASADAFWVGRTPPPDGIRVCIGAPRSTAELEIALRTIAQVLSSAPALARL